MTSCGHVTIIFDDVKTYGQIQVDSGIKSHHPNTFDGPAKHLLVGEEMSLSQPVRMHNDLVVAGARYLEGNVYVLGVSTFQKLVEVDANLLFAEIPLSFGTKSMRMVVQSPKTSILQDRSIWRRISIEIKLFDRRDRHTSERMS